MWVCDCFSIVTVAPTVTVDISTGAEPEAEPAAATA
jgi:hypothetical protein